jgi:undecaprenyl diphosphate synthase
MAITTTSPENFARQADEDPGLARRLPVHVGIIMDGNGRWAAARGLSRLEGHRRGVEAVRRAVRAAIDLNIRYLTLYSFSTENWSRPAQEVAGLLMLLKRFIRHDLADLHANNVRVKIIGERQGLAPDLRALLTESEDLTRDNHGLTLVIAFSYGSRQEIAAAVQRIAVKLARGEVGAQEISPEMITDHLDTAGMPDPDLIIRTSGEERLSNFLLWQAAYAELVFLDLHWPDFDHNAFAGALETFAARERRFGKVSMVRVNAAP